MAYTDNWREDLKQSVIALGETPEENWRANVKLIRELLESGAGSGGGTGVIPDNSITTSKIANGAVTPEKLSQSYALQSIMDTVLGDIEDIKKSSNHTLWVSNSSQADEENGSEIYPYKTFEAAIAAAKFGDVIVIEPGEYELSDIVTITQDNLTIITLGAEGQFRVVIDGYIQLDETAKRIGLSGLSISGGLDVYCEEGLVYADKCDFANLNISQEVAGYCKFTNCYYESSVTLLGSGLTDFVNCQWETNAICNIETGNAYFIGCRQLHLAHMGGIVLIYGDTQCVAINSDALLEEGNLLALLSGSILKADGTFTPIVITACSYLIGNFYHDASLDSISGVRLPIGNFDYDLLVSYTPNNYIPANNTLEAHLEAIDAKLASLSGGA